MGIALYPRDGHDIDSLTQAADAAMYHAKQAGRNTYRFFTPQMQAQSLRALQLENALRRALERNQLYLHYQPQITLSTGRVRSVEALLRWEHPELGSVSPAEFIPVAEDSGQIDRPGAARTPPARPPRGGVPGGPRALPAHARPHGAGA